MKYINALAVLAGAVIIAVAIVCSARLQRYELATASPGTVVRLDRSTGETLVCPLRNAGDGTVVAPCDGGRR